MVTPPRRCHERQRLLAGEAMAHQWLAAFQQSLRGPITVIWRFCQAHAQLARQLVFEEEKT